MNDYLLFAREWTKLFNPLRSMFDPLSEGWRVDMLEARLLGKYEVHLNSRLIDVSSRPAQSLLAYLLLNPNQPIRREKLAGLIWPDSSESNARSNLRHALWRVRKSFDSEGGAYLQADDLTLSFRLQTDDWVDVRILDTDIQDDVSIDVLIEILSVYGGELLPGFYEDWVAVERERLKSVFEQKMTLLLDRLVAESQWAEVINWGERWISLGFTPENAFRSMMMAYAGLGDRGKVAAVYQRCILALERDLGVKPSRQTREIYERLKGGDRAGQVTQLGESLHIESRPRHNLPPSLTPLIGREADLERVEALLADPGCRLLSLVGPGGIGKSSLSLRAAANQVGSYRHGVYLVPLAGVASPCDLPSAIAGALGLELLGRSDPEQQLLDILADQHLLLLLDNFEHLLPETGLLAGILHQAPQVTLLVTSRQRLNLRAEWVFPLAGLPFPEANTEPGVRSYAAVQMFLQTARRIQAKFNLLESDWPHLARICRLVEGTPLAIELAASWTRLLSPGEIAAEIERGVDILATATRDLPDRHRSMRAVFNHSWKFLSAPERRVLRRLSVFRGGFARQAAEEVAGASLPLLSALIDKSLLRLEPRSGDTQRYDLHELVRQFAHARLLNADEVAQTRDRHLDHYLGLAELAEPQLMGPDSPLWLDRLAREQDNLRAAFSWAAASDRAHDGALAQRLVRALMWFWLMRGPFGEGVRWAERALSLDSSHALSRAGAVWVTGYLNHFVGNHTVALQMLEQGVALCRKMGLAGREELAWALNFLGLELESAGEPASAQACWEESLALWQELDDPRGIAPALINLGYLALERGAYDRATGLLEDGLAAAHASGERSWRVLARLELGKLAAGLDDEVQARALYHEALLICQELRSNWWAAETIALLAELEAHQDELDRLARAARLWGAAETLYKHSASRPRQLDYGSGKRSTAAARRRLGDDAFTEAWSQGQSMTFDRALAFALE